MLEKLLPEFISRTNELILSQFPTSVLGKGKIRTNVIIGAGTFLVDRDIPDSSTVLAVGMTWF